MHEVTPPDVLEMVRKIEARGALDISRRAKQGVSQVFQFAIACGMASVDPTSNLRGALKPRPRVKHMSRIPLAELPEFVDKVRAYQEEGDRRSSVTRDAVLLEARTVFTSSLSLAADSCRKTCQARQSCGEGLQERAKCCRSARDVRL